ncbi:MAG: RnfABCDGE type electron transport complex subunit B [Burkholderiales bacterium]|nr:RnfABCDGE type electron transport complex subunit B [Burkholderiales bacterium]MDQ3195525.1 RnfABCDGE type electron transport complex subunit B [Pseudomonadota bacterium]
MTATSVRALIARENSGPPEQPLADRIDALLPQTQCGQCGYTGCKPYADAIAEGEAAINQCPPGGDEGIRALAELLGVSCLPLNPQYGEHKPKTLAVIDETRCIGCALCLAACPVDAIVGARKKMHTVIAAECTGCALCLPPCPVDCIALQPAAEMGAAARRAASDLARERYRFRAFRLARDQREADEKLAENTAAARAFGDRLSEREVEPDFLLPP